MTNLMTVNIEHAGKLLKKITAINLLMSGNSNMFITPCLISNPGVGKTSIAEYVASDIGGMDISIDCTTICIGELNGMPDIYADENGERVADYTQFYVFAAIRNKEKEIYQKAKTVGLLNGNLKLNENDDIEYYNGEETQIFRNKKSMFFTKNQYSFGTNLPNDIKIELIKNGDIAPVIVLMDELNRGQGEVLAETMNVLLKHRIQSYLLPWWVTIAAAMNPGGISSDDHVRSINGANLSRFTNINVISDVDCWVKHEIRNNGDVALIETLSTSCRNYFEGHPTPRFVEQKADGRGWSFISNIKKYMSEISRLGWFNRDELNDNEIDLRILAEGKVGTIANTVLEMCKNVDIIPTPSDFMTGSDKYDETVIQKLKTMDGFKQYLFMELLGNLLADKMFIILNSDSKTSNMYLSQFDTIFKTLDPVNQTQMLEILKQKTVRDSQGRTYPLASILVDKHPEIKEENMNNSIVWCRYIFDKLKVDAIMVKDME